MTWISICWILAAAAFLTIVEAQRRSSEFASADERTRPQWMDETNKNH
jgi:hypothetical protein